MRSADNYEHMRLTDTDSDQAISERVAAEVRAEIARQRLSQDVLADRLGWSQQRVSRRITGVVPFDIAELVAMAEVLGVPVGQFLPTPVRAS